MFVVTMQRKEKQSEMRDFIHGGIDNHMDIALIIILLVMIVLL